MIHTKAQTFELYTQHTIGILDTEFNRNNGYIRQQKINNSINLGTISDEQFARPNRSSVEDIITKCCTLDHRHSTRWSFAITGYDLTSCYDRIIHTAAALALLRIGISHTRIENMFSTIQKMIHRIRTIYGNSDISYGGELGNCDNWPH